MLSVNLYELLLAKYFETRYNTYKSLMQVLKSEYDLSNLSDEDFVKEMLQRYGKSKSIFDEDVDINSFKNMYDNYIKYSQDDLNAITQDGDGSHELDDYSLDYFKEPKFVNKVLNLNNGNGFKHSLHSDGWQEDIFCDILEYVSDEVRNDEEYFEKINDVPFPSLIGKKLRNDEDFILKNIFDRFEYLYISDELKHNRDFILKLMDHDEYYFYCLDEKFRDDKEIVLKVLEKRAKEVSKDAMQNDSDNSSVTMASDPFASFSGRIILRVDYGFMDYVSDRLKHDPEIIEKALDLDSDEYEYLPKEFKNDKKIIEKLFKKGKDVSMCFENEIRSDTKYMEELYLKYDFSIVNTNKEIIQKYANNKEVMKKEIYKNNKAIQYLGADLLNDKEYIIDVIKNAEPEIALYDRELLKRYKDDEDVMEALIKHDPEYFKYASTRLRKKKAFNEKIKKLSK